MSKSSRNKSAKLITKALLKSWELPGQDDGGDKEQRGRVLVIAGCEQMPGAAILAATAALRAGAGKLQIAVPKSAAPWVALGVPEALVLALPELRGTISASGSLKLLRSRLEQVDAVLIGPGMNPGSGLDAFVKSVLPFLSEKVLVLDAAALTAVPKLQKDFAKFRIQAVITPHAGEMANLLDLEKSTILKDPQEKARQFSQQSGVVVALKGSETFIATPNGDAFKNTAGNVGLGVSGSGDTLAGILAGLAARGASAAQAAVWAVHLHACAGDVLAKRMGPLGYLPRELLFEIPSLLRTFGRR
jgi:hydroxyethylthiazole kinase-like uncharacterized protein yjeF